MDEHDFWRYVGYALAPIFWLVVPAVLLWIVRMVRPQWERTLFDPIGVVLRRWRRNSRAARPRP